MSNNLTTDIVPDTFFSAACDFLADLKADGEAPLADLLRREYESGQQAAVEAERQRINAALDDLKPGWLEGGENDGERAVLLEDVRRIVAG